jgi:pimeloyl-ACP methyl ester carboxylesterase
MPVADTNPQEEAMNCSRMSPAGLFAIAIGVAVALGSGAGDEAAVAASTLSGATAAASGAATTPPSGSATPSAAAKAAPAPPARRFDSAVLHVEVSGKGRPMLLIPGLATSGEVWRDAVARYSASHECHAVTLGGFAGSPPFEGPFLETARQALFAYVREQKLERPIVVGHSLGGVLALQLAAESPEAIGPVVVLDAVPFLGGLGQPQATSETVRAQMEPMRRMIAGQSQEAYAAFQKTAPHLRGIVTGEANFARVLDWASTSNPAAVADAMADVYSTDLRNRVADIRSPLLVLGSWYGFKDFSTREAVEGNFRAQYAKAPRWSFALADTARHFLMLDDPEWTWTAVSGFLDSLAAVRPVAGGGH